MRILERNSPFDSMPIVKILKMLLIFLRVKPVNTLQDKLFILEVFHE